MQAKLILCGLLGILNSKLRFDKDASYTQKMLAEELIDDVDNMLAKAYEKGLYE